MGDGGGGFCSTGMRCSLRNNLIRRVADICAGIVCDRRQCMPFRKRPHHKSKLVLYSSSSPRIGPSSFPQTFTWRAEGLLQVRRQQHSVFQHTCHRESGRHSCLCGDGGRFSFSQSLVRSKTRFLPSLCPSVRLSDRLPLFSICWQIAVCQMHRVRETSHEAPRSAMSQP